MSITFNRFRKRTTARPRFFVSASTSAYRRHETVLTDRDEKLGAALAFASMWSKERNLGAFHKLSKIKAQPAAIIYKENRFESDNDELES